ncbi:MAG: leucine-rich repeat domain-containing protein, partial [Bacillota bacterium]
IGVGAFEACRSLTTITLPENAGFTAIPDSLFGECADLESITIPQSVTSIGDNVFQGCSTLAEINVAAGSSAFSSEDGVLYDAGKTLLIRHPAGRLGVLD